MGRTPCHSKLEIKKGPWTSHEHKILKDYVSIHGEGNWKDIAQKTGLKRCEKSCRFRWLNYLRPDLKLGNNISEDEEDLIIRLHRLLGNRWKLIAGRLPGRSGNEIKNYWNTTLSKKLLTDQENKYNQDAKLEKKSEQQPQLTATSTTGAEGPNFETKSNITIVDTYEQQNGDKMQHHKNQTSFWEYDPCENDDLMSFWVNSEIGDYDALDGNIQYKEHDSETMAGVLADYGCSSDNFSKEP